MARPKEEFITFVERSGSYSAYKQIVIVQKSHLYLIFNAFAFVFSITVYFHSHSIRSLGRKIKMWYLGEITNYNMGILGCLGGGLCSRSAF